MLTHITIEFVGRDALIARYTLVDLDLVLLEQIRTIDKKRLGDKMGELDLNSMNKVNTALSISFGLEM